ncbi:EAL domain-containing protein [Chitinimonas sp. BJYL2]|uniref:EAL domain-containing protein n=1 Tax=Chitinimonas sp. BJYL2 TaxID=2976696 RepID=UPI0022B56D3A|nr:EAL domain-containing protein [Chitinimonas sp. BJYL2]
MELFAQDEAVAALETSLATLTGEERLSALLPLAWHLRQRDCERALKLADEAHGLLAADRTESRHTMALRARLTLLKAEIRALFADLGEAEELAKAALTAFQRIDDPIGAGDCLWLQGSIEVDRGNRAQVEALQAETLAAYRAGADPIREQACIARSLAMTAFSDPDKAAAGITKHFPDKQHHDPGLHALVAIARANVAGLTNDPGTALKYDLEAYHGALGSGQLRQALVCASNVVEGFATLGELDTALQWSEQSLALARRSRWPGSIGVCLMQTGDVLRQVGRPEEAREHLLEGLAVMAALAGSRNQEQILGHLGQLELDDGNDTEAIAWFQRLENGLSAQREPDLLMKALRGRATCLSRLGRSTEALDCANAALDLARAHRNADGQIRSLIVLAEIHHDPALPPPPGMKAAAAPLHFLEQALQQAESISGYAVPVELFTRLAQAHADSGDYRAAYECGQAAHAARNRTRSEEAQRRALAMQIRNEVDRARADTEHHKRLAGTLQEANATLETLGRIGREITASLDANAVFEALYRHVNRLLDAASFAIYLLDEPTGMLSVAFGVDNGQPHPAYQVLLTSKTSLAARCARERREIVIDHNEDDVATRTIPGTVVTESMLFSPLEAGKRLLGVMTIQSEHPHAYSERECSIFRTLCAYGAIALDNAAAYGAMEAARRHAAEQEQELRVAAAAFESQEGMMISDSQRVILRVNSAFTRITGYPADAVVGKLPDLFRSARHDSEFYDQIIRTVMTAGSWQGEIWIRHARGHPFPLWLVVTAVRAADGTITNLVYALVDITERKLAEDEIRSLAFYDPLTNLPNRRLLMDRLRQALAQSDRNGQEGALLFVDLDNFKKLNDTRGHDVGDLLLQEVAKRLSAHLREGDTVARLGGDEFVILLEGISDDALEAAERVEVVGKKILATLNEPYVLQGSAHHSTPSVGVCLFRGQAITVEELLKQADLAMYQAKAAGRNTVRFFDPAMQAAVSAHAALEADLRQALDDQQLSLFFQPQVDRQGLIVGAEALVRWRHPERGMVSPADFIPLAEETGLILPLGDWVLDTACRQLAAWAACPASAHLTVAVNISARQFHDAGFSQLVHEAVARHGIRPDLLKLELTESLLLKDVESVIAKMNALRMLGIRFSLDDFGTGYSSLSYLKRLPLSQLKIDQSFVRDIFDDTNDMAIVRAVVTLGQSMGLEVIAEGVETEQQWRYLQEIGCNRYQGYLFGKPAPAASLSALLDPARAA